MSFLLVTNMEKHHIFYILHFKVRTPRSVLKSHTPQNENENGHSSSQPSVHKGLTGEILESLGGVRVHAPLVGMVACHTSVEKPRWSAELLALMCWEDNTFLGIFAKKEDKLSYCIKINVCILVTSQSEELWKCGRVPNLLHLEMHDL